MDKNRVLIIEDDKDTAFLFRTVLNLVGFDCETVLTAKEALAWLATSVPDLVLLDMRLGLEIGGGDILYQIRSNDRFEYTRVVVITGYPRLAEPITNLADLILLKPVEIDQLKELVSRIGYSEQKPKRLPFKDPITELYNEDFFLTRLELAFERVRRRENFNFAIMLFEHKPDESIDRNIEPEVMLDTLRAIAERLTTNLRPTDTIARLSGWRFATLHEELVKPTDIEIIIKRLQKELQKPYRIRSIDYYMKLSFGAAVYDARYKEPKDMFAAAQQALNQALAFGQTGIYVVATMPRIMDSI
jgi:diguanylate cyclase (GGDEF)-like protein